MKMIHPHYQQKYQYDSHRSIPQQSMPMKQDPSSSRDSLTRMSLHDSPQSKPWTSSIRTLLLQTNMI